MGVQRGQDRAGLMFRYAAADMVKRLNLERRFAKLKDDIVQEAREKRVISRALWGKNYKVCIRIETYG